MDIKGYEDYTISRQGEVWSKKYKKYLKPCKNGGGYLFVGLCKDGKRKYMTIHRLIALAYIDNPENKPEVDHIDRNRTNNNITNLRWATIEEQNRNRDIISNTGYKYISKINTNGYDYYRVEKKKVFCYSLRCDQWTFEEAVEIRDCLCRRHDVPLLDWVD